MSFLDALFGRAKPIRSRQEQLLNITTAAIALEFRHRLKPTGRAGLALRPLPTSDFKQTAGEMRQLLQIGARETASKLALARDDFGYLWVVVRDEQFEDAVSLLYSACVALTDSGYRDQLLAAMTEFRDEEGKIAFWIYNFKRAKFYPFVPLGTDKGRDNGRELRLAAVMKGELPIESDPSQWYALWGAPLEAANSGGL